MGAFAFLQSSAGFSTPTVLREDITNRPGQCILQTFTQFFSDSFFTSR